MHYFKGAREHRPPWGPLRWTSDRQIAYASMDTLSILCCGAFTTSGIIDIVCL